MQSLTACDILLLSKGRRYIIVVLHIAQPHTLTGYGYQLYHHSYTTHAEHGQQQIHHKPWVATNKIRKEGYNMARTSITIPGDLRQHYTQYRDVIYSPDMDSLINIGYLLASLDREYRTSCQTKTVKVAAPTKPNHTSRDIAYGLRAHKYIIDHLGETATPDDIQASVHQWHTVHTTAKASATTMLASQQLRQYAKAQTKATVKSKEAKPADAQTLSTKGTKSRARGNDTSRRIPKVSYLHYLAYRWLVEACKVRGDGIGIDRRTNTLRTMHAIALERMDEINQLREEALSEYAFDEANDAHREILKQDWAVRVRKTLDLSDADMADAMMALVLTHPEIKTYTPAPPKRRGTRRATK